MKYEITFSLKNGVQGKATITAPSDKTAYLTVTQWFANCNEYDWDMKKIEDEER